MKKAIKKLKKQLNAEVIELANAIKEDRRNIYELSVKYIRHMKRVSELFAELENKADRYEIKTIAKHVQNLEAEKEKNCSCKEKSSIIDPDRPKEIVSPLIDFRNAVAFHYANAVGKSIVDYIKTNPNQSKSGLAESKRETIQFNGEPLEVTEMQKLVLRDHFTLENTNTQKTDKNATERQGSGKKEYSETIVTNEMFNKELEKRFAESFTQDHPAFLLLNKDLDSGIIESLIRSKLQSKGNHYSPNGDRYSNFKRLNGYANKKTVKERIENFKEKHEIWIEDYQAGDVNGTLLDLIESCVDVLCYKLLLDVYLKFNPEA